MTDRLPVLWLCGPPGVGKSTIAWELFTGLPDAGHVDIDQLGMCYPEIPSDPGRTLLEGRILGGVVADFRAAGASCLIVSGYISARHGIHTRYLPDAELSVVRLRCDPRELRHRLLERARNGDQLDAELAAAEELDGAGLPYPVLDTSGRTVADALAAVRDGWPDPPARQPGPWPDPVPAPGEIVWVCGATATGKSTVGWEVAEAFRRAGHTTGFVDLQQIGFLRPGPGGHRLKAANLAALWQQFHAHGARRLVVNGSVEHPADVLLYRSALPAAEFTLHRLHAGPDELRSRIRQRGLGFGPPIVGDELRGQPADVLDRAHEAAVAQASALEQAGLGDTRVETDGRTPREIADEIQQVHAAHAVRRLRPPV